MIKQILKTFSILGVFLAVPGFASAAPSINSAVPVTTFSHGEILNISGAGFGVKSPVAPTMWDPVDGQAAYASLLDGALIPVGGNNPWPGVGSTNVAHYKTTNPRGKITAHYSNQWNLAGNGKATLGELNFTSQCTGKKLYISWWLYGSGQPNLTPPGNSSNKFFRLTPNGQWATTSIAWEPTMYTGLIFSTQQHPLLGWVDWSTFGNMDVWNRNEILVDNTTEPIMPRVVGTVNARVLFDTFPTESYPMDTCGIGTFGFDASNSDGLQPMVDFGEIYIDNTVAKVEIGDAPTWATSTHREIQIPQTTWNDGQLQIKINQGSFPDNSVAYLYVIDADGNVNVNGKPIAFGSSQASTCTDGIKNGSETGIDCGGSCAVCIQTYSISNLLTLVTNWLKTGTVSDVNSDGAVNVRDLGIMMSKWGN